MEERLIAFETIDDFEEWMEMNCHQCINFSKRCTISEELYDAYGEDIESSKVRVPVSTLEKTGHSQSGWGYTEINKKCRFFFPAPKNKA